MKASLEIDVLSLAIPIDHPISKRRKTPVSADELLMSIEARADAFWVWDYSCNFSNEWFAFDPKADPRLARHIAEIPHLDEVFQFTTEQYVANRGTLIATHLEPAVHAMEAAIAARDGSSVYFADAGGQIKIGWSKKVGTRIAQLQTGSAVPIRLVGTVPGGRGLERRLHDQFAHLRLVGEWFVAAPELLDHIATVTSINSRRPA